MNECDWMDHFRKLLDGFGIPDTTLECSSQGWPEDVVGCVEVKDVKVRYSIGLNSIMFSDARARKHFLYELVCRYGDKAEFLEEEELPRFVFFHELAHIFLGCALSAYAIAEQVTDEEDALIERKVDLLALSWCRVYRMRIDTAGRENESENNACDGYKNKNT